MNGFDRQSDNRIEQFIAMAALAVLAIGCLVILSPFVSALLWAVILCFSTWPLYRRTERLCGGRRTLAAAVLTLLVALVLLGPLALVGVGLADNVTAVAGAVRVLLEEGPPDPPPWLAGLPLVGGRAAAYWQSLAHNGAALAAELRRYVSPAVQWVLGTGLSLGEGILYLSLSILIGFFLYRDGAAAAGRLEAALGRIAGDRGRRLLEVAGGTMQGVVYGILGACLVQGLLAAFGFWLAGVPAPVLLGVLTAVLALVPLGPALVWLPASLWLFKTGAVGWGVFIILWGLFVVGTIDNVIKPYFISRGGGLPFVLVLLGVLGGVVAFGFLGLFIGPTLLAVGYSLLREWTVIERQQRTERPARGAGAAPAAAEAAPAESEAAPAQR